MKPHRSVWHLRAWHFPLTVVIIGSMLVFNAGTGFGAPRDPHPAPKPAQAPVVKHVSAVKPRFAPAKPTPAPYRATKTTWPKEATTTIRLDTPAAGAKRVPRASAAATSVWTEPLAPAAGRAYAGPGELRIKVLDHAAATAAGVDGVLVTVSADRAGEVRMGLDYRQFAQAYGGNYGARLRLVSYPSCVLTTPQAPACQLATDLNSTNDVAKGAVSAKVAVASTAQTTVLAATAAASGGEEGGASGTYSATSLKPSGTWTSGSSSGDFSYAYPLDLADSPSSLLPKVGLSYNSSVTDGQTAATEAQASWVGEGWSTPSSFVEQSFQSCSESPEGSAAPTKTYDVCYDGPIFALSLNGTSTALVWDSAKKVFKTEDAAGAVVKHWCTKTDDPTCTSGTSNGSTAYAQDWWQVTERNGTTYSFGMNHLPGWASGKAATNSVATEPVYSAHKNDPCYDSAGMSSSVCTMAYRWGLDYAVDTHGNAMSYYYKQDTNYYGKFKGASNVSYVRDMHLDHIDYGFTDGDAYGTAPDKVVFKTSERCVTSGCGPLNSANASKWPDVPFDLVCASGAKCKSYSPSYYSTVRLTSIEAQQWSVSASKYTVADSYALTQTMPAPGDGTAATLWLSSIVHTGSDRAGGGSTTAIALPAVTFTPIQLQNRVDTTSDGLPAFYKFRIGTITTETGSQINVTYDLVNPCTAPVKTTASTNTSSCYPVSWTPDGYTAPITDWFNKYVVTSVQQTDPTGGASAQLTSYQYVGGAAWHYDVNELVKAKYRSYGQFRGYGDVIAYLGDGVNDRKAKSETTYYRGMSKNNNSTVTNVKDSQGGLHEDVDQLAGKTLETSAYLGDAVDHSTITSYWVSDAAASRSRTGLPALTSTWVAPVETFSREAVTSTGSTTWRYTATDTTYAADPDDTNFGLPTRAYAHTIPANPDYDSCESTTYAAANPGKNLVGLVAQAETDSVACGGYTVGAKPSVPGSVNTLTAPASVSRPAQVVSATRSYYDDKKFATAFPQAAAPTKGDVTMVRKAVDYTSGAFTWQTTSRSTFDAIGRQTDSYDGNGNDTKTTYTDNSAGLTVGKTITNPLGQTASSTLEPQRGSTLTATDGNGIVTTQQYDALGRLTSVWLANRSISSPANNTFAYYISNSGPTATVTKKLNDSSGYQTSTLIYDGLLRERQTQRMTPQGGRLVTDNLYDSRGWVSTKYTDWWDSAVTPNTTLASAADLHTQVPKADVYTYNSLGDVVIDSNQKNGVELSHTTTVDNGDRKTVFPPEGGTTATTVTDAVGRTVEVGSYLTAPTLTSPSDPFTGTFKVTGGTTESLTYGYDGHGKQNSVSQGAAGSGGPTWTETYNLLGQAVAKSDPDAGATTGMTYDGDGNLLQSTDARGKTVSYAYDALSRKIGKYASTVTGQADGAAGNQMAAWAYDNSNGIAGVTHGVGELTTSTSYKDGAAYTKQQLNFNVFGDSLGVSLTVPSEQGQLAGTYTVRQTYSTTTGLPLKDVYSTAQGGLPAETVNRTYQGVLDLPDALNGLAGYDQGTTYDAYGKVNQQTLGSGANLAYVTNTYDPNSGRITDRLVTRTGGSTTRVDEQAYDYDPAGNVLAQSSTRLGSAASSETQCYNYDGIGQLIGAWTANDCVTAPSDGKSSMVASALGAASAYWTTWSIDTRGNRSSEVRHAFAGGPSADLTTGYTYGTSGNQPHTLTSTAPSDGESASFGYDASGNMTSRKAGQGDQTLSFNDANQLTAITGSTAGSSSFVYDADGQILLQKDPNSTVLYDGSQQFTLNTVTDVVSGVRYYDLPGGGQAIRTGVDTTSFGFALADQHNTPTLYLDNTAQNPTWRQYTPYGDNRGTAVTAPDNHGFLNKPTDTATGLTIVGIRQYDPALGRFITDDPVLERTDPTQLNGYSYAGNNPVVKSDPTGEMFPADEGGGGGSASHYTSPTIGLSIQGNNNKWDAYDERNRRAPRGKGRTTAANFDRHTGHRTANPNGLNRPIGIRRCAEFNCTNGYDNGPERLWTKAVTTDPDAGSPVRGRWTDLWRQSRNDFGDRLYYKAVCGTCQENSLPSQYEGGTPADPGGRWGVERTSRFTRTGTSMLERTLSETKGAGAILKKVNGGLEGAAPALKAVGVVGTVATVAFDVYDVATAPPARRAHVASESVGELAGSIGGAALGAAVGGPVGAVIGGYLGGLAGRKAGGFVADLFGW